MSDTDDIFDSGYMPDFSGWSGADAELAIRNHGYNAWPRETPSLTDDAGKVLYSEPRAGQLILQQTLVTWVSTGRPIIEPPRHEPITELLIRADNGEPTPLVVWNACREDDCVGFLAYPSGPHAQDVQCQNAGCGHSLAFHTAPTEIGKACSTTDGCNGFMGYLFGPHSHDRDCQRPGCEHPRTKHTREQF